ncbi:MAG: TonB-dependent receptor [Gemmatimonadaceae bacterium]|nr:TonB-dependent receptor [Gemmatimonadaceae bacterium]
MSFVLRSTLVLAVAALPAAARAQAVGPDSARRATRDTLEAVMVRATRAGTPTPTTRTTLARRDIERLNQGQDAPLLLQALPSVTTTSDAGAYSGYSAIRLRGVDQTRLAISVDGVPLNDPEDQVLYFSNVPDFLNSMASVTVQRGVGASAFGTAPFAGALNFESAPLATARDLTEYQLTMGSFGTRRASVEKATGLHRGFAAYGRLSAQRTDGYRAHSGNRARSAFLSAGWFGTRDAVKFTGFAGRSRMQLAYYAASEAELAADRRTNPMSPDERDDFHQEMASLQWTHAFGERLRLQSTVYRNGAGGAYDVAVAPELWNFNLDHRWVGLLSSLSYERPGLQVAAGAHASRYSRDHYLKIRPDLDTRIYDNTGFKEEQSAFVKATVTRGAVDLSGDLQLRRAAFRYRPSPGTTFPEPSIDWVFLNPKVGLTWRARPRVELFASLGSAGREPTRSDLFAGNDDLDDATAAAVLPLDRVRPERLLDLEAGVRVRRARHWVSANVFSMRFADEIAPIGALTLNGTQLRRNVGRTTRTGVELEGSADPGFQLTVSGNLMLLDARIARYTDEASGTTYRDVPPLLTPRVIGNLQLVRHQGDGELSLGVRHIGRSQLANDGNAALVTPAFTTVEFGTLIPFLGNLIRVQVQNLLDARGYASGYTDGTTRYLFPVAGRTILATLVISF